MPNGVPTLWWRSVGHTHTAYAVETFFDELLALGGKDPVAGRLALIEGSARQGRADPRRRTVRLGQARCPPAARAASRCTRASAPMSRRSPRCRAAPTACRASTRSGARSIAASRSIPTSSARRWRAGSASASATRSTPRSTLGEGGRVEQTNFDTYRIARASARCPRSRSRSSNPTENPTGVGEPGRAAVAPAVANAWRKLTGKAVRRLPFARPENQA